MSLPTDENVVLKSRKPQDDAGQNAPREERGSSPFFAMMAGMVREQAREVLEDTK